MGLFDFFKSKPETLANEYMGADKQRRYEIEKDMLREHGLERYRNGTWGPVLGDNPSSRVYCSECGGYFLPHEH